MVPLRCSHASPGSIFNLSDVPVLRYGSGRTVRYLPEAGRYGIRAAVAVDLISPQVRDVAFVRWNAAFAARCG